MSGVLGIIGAGKLGTTIGRAAADAGWQVLMHDTAEMAEMIVETMIPDAHLVPLAELVDRAEIVMLAVPFGLSGQLDYPLLSGKIVLDPMNHWPAVDGDVPALAGWTSSTTELLATRNPAMRLVKSLNHLGYHDYTGDARSGEVPHRRAVAVASDDQDAAEHVAQLVDDIGFDPVLVPLDRSKLLEPGGPVFGVWLDAPSLREILS